MANKTMDLEFAARVVESQFSESLSRYDTLNQKLGTYIATLTILVSILWIVIGLLLDKDGLIVKVIQHTSESPLKTIISLIILSLNLLTALLSSTFSIVRVIQALTPVTLQQIDDMTVLTAIKKNKLKALKIYIGDMNSAIEANREAIRNRVSVLFSINRWLIVFIIAFGCMFISYIIFLFLSNSALPHLSSPSICF